MDPGQALRNDGLNPPRPPTLGGRLQESGIQAAETIIAGGAAGAAAASQSFAESRTFNWRGLAGSHAANPQEAARPGPAARRGASASDHRQAFRGRAPARASRPEIRGGGARSRSRHRAICVAAAGRSRSFRRLCHGCRICGGHSGGGNSSRKRAEEL